MVNDNIHDDEMLYRLNRESYPNTWIDGKPSLALFIDPLGLSTQRDGGRNEEEIVCCCKQRFRKRDPLNGIVKLVARDCRRIKTYPKAINNHRDIYHAEIHNSENDSDKEITLFKAKMLADSCSVVFYNEH